MSTLPAHPHLRQLAETVQTTRANAETLFNRLSDSQCIWKPNPKVWNVLECFAHVITTDRLYMARIEDLIGRAPRSTDAYKPSWFGRTFIKRLEPGTGALRTFDMFRPETAFDDLTVRDSFLAHTDDLLALLQRADGHNLNRPKLSSPVTRLVRFSLGEAFGVLVTHGRRHLDQAERLTQHPDFPK